MRKYLSWLFLIFLGVTTSFQTLQEEWNEYKCSGKAQGTSYSIIYYHTGLAVTQFEVDSIFQEIDNSLSVYNPRSLISKFNESTKGLEVDAHLFNIYRYSLQINKATGGISDLTIGPITAAWGLASKKMTNPPSASETKKLMTCVGMDKISLKGNLLIKKKSCVKLDPNGIAQGYTVDVLANFFLKKGIENFLIEVGGETRWKGKKMTSNKPFILALESIDSDGWEIQYKKVELQGEGAITTSGNYRKFKESAGKLRSHAFDARTGQQSNNELIAVTLMAKDATTADGYDNAVLAMGLKQALKFLKTHTYLSARLIYTTRDGLVSDTLVNRFPEPLANH
ncbi:MULTISPECIES: FAD:protein FMN transferase [unclassified Paraflavitalea]|uniref:FAD:protein FMN transferase n=1 Tax=unclassified Paraflavitalea TaxID=2798305 RepID=UPI003D329EFE